MSYGKYVLLTVEEHEDLLANRKEPEPINSLFQAPIAADIKFAQLQGNIANSVRKRMSDGKFDDCVKYARPGDQFDNHDSIVHSPQDAAKIVDRKTPELKSNVLRNEQESSVATRKNNVVEDANDEEEFHDAEGVDSENDSDAVLRSSTHPPSTQSPKKSKALIAKERLLGHFKRHPGVFQVDENSDTFLLKKQQLGSLTLKKILDDFLEFF